jgi:hypothetical protein
VTGPSYNVGAFVLGAPTSPRALVRHAALFAAYADGALEDEREAYLSHFAFGPEMADHFHVHRKSVAGFEGPCWCRRLVLDIDRADLKEALADARRLVQAIGEHYPELEGDLPVYFSGKKGFHVLVDLAHNPPPAVGFQRVARTFAEAIAARAGVRIDPSVYDVAHIIRLPNTRHPATGRFKRRIDAEALFALDATGILDLAKHPAGDGIPAVGTPPARLAEDWRDAEREAARADEARAAARRDLGTAEARAPRYLVDFLRFGVGEGERRPTLFRCAAWLAEQGAPPSLCSALLTEPALDLGLTPKDVERQIRCGIEHAGRQGGAVADPPPAAAAGAAPPELRQEKKGAVVAPPPDAGAGPRLLVNVGLATGAEADPPPDPSADPEAFERWAIRHEADQLPPGATDFPFGALAPAEGGPA